MCRKCWNMRKILLASIKNAKKVLAAGTLMIIVNLISIGHFELFPAVLVGYALAAFYIVSMAARISSVMGLSQEQAKRRMLFGLILRMAMLLIVLFVGLKISEMVFFSMVTGFLTFYLISQLGLIVTSYKRSYHNRDDADEK